MRVSRRLCAGGESCSRFVARMAYTRLSKCVMFEELVVGTGCVRWQEMEWVECLLDGLLRAYGINAKQWATAAQYKREWDKTAEQGAGRFMAKWIAAEKVRVGLRHAVVCPDLTGRTKERIAQSKSAHASSRAIVDKPRTCILRAFFCLRMPCCLSLALGYFLCCKKGYQKTSFLIRDQNSASYVIRKGLF